MNKVFFIGNLVKDAELNYTKNKKVLLNLNIAVNHSYDDKADFFFLKGFGNRWEKVSQYLTKGVKISVEGHLQNNNFEDEEGYTEFRNDIVIDNIELLCRPQSQSEEKTKYKTRKHK